MKIKENKINLLQRDSALEFLPRLTNYLNGPKIYIKRDDEGGRSGGGNKLRKYERIIGDALAGNCDTLIIAGHYQSNAARELVGSACQLGLKSIVVCKELISSQNENFNKNGNALLMNILGAELVAITKDDDFQEAMKAVAETVIKKGGKPYLIPFGGSNALGALGYSDCVDEIIQQCKNHHINIPDYIFTATGSGGTQAGLLVGVAKNNIKSQVIGISVLHKEEVAVKTISNLLNEIWESSDTEKVAKDKIIVDDAFIGSGYGIPTEQCIETIKLLAKLEGIFLCPVYTAKAMTGLIEYIKSGKIENDKTVVFIHTGGNPLLYAYQDVFF